MSFGKDIFCHGIEPYNFRDTDETVATITANVGQSTAIGPKVAIRRNKPFPPLGEVVAIDMGAGKSSSNFNRNLSPTITCTHGGEPVIGTIDASIYRKNSNQDNSKYIIKTHRKNKMDNKNIDLLMKAAKDGVDVVGLMGSLEANLKLVKDGVLSIDEAITACEDLRNTLGKKAGKEAKERIESGIEKVKEMAKEYESMKEAIKDINNDAPHQQDQLNCQDDAARTLAAGTHGAASHLTKTCVEGEDDDGEEMCVVRRLTPTETARLQGFPDDYTKIDGPETADAPQFKAHGNSWATPCANFMNTRIEMELRRLGHEGTIRYATCCSGVEAHSVSVRDLDWKSVFFSEIEPFPCRLLEKHYPDTPNLGDMTQIHYDEKAGAISNAHKEGEEYSLPSCFKEAQIRELPFKVGDLEVFSGGTPCFTKGAFVLTKEGYKPIEDVVVGDEVVTHKGRFRKVLRVGKKRSSDLVEVTVCGRGKFVCTADHPFPLSRLLRNKNGDGVYIDKPKLMPIKDGENLFAQVVNTNVYDFGVKMPKLPTVDKASSEEVLNLCGLYVCSGRVVRKESVVLYLNATEYSSFTERFNRKVKYLVSKSGDTIKVVIRSVRLANFVGKHFGEHEKRIPVWAYNDEARGPLVRGYLKEYERLNLGDINWGTLSPAIAYGFADAVGNSSVGKNDTKGNFGVFSGKVSKVQYDYSSIGKFDYTPVIDVKHLDGVTDLVYNIEVDEDHTYIVNGIVTHNCQSVSVAGKREGMAENSGTRSSLAFHYQRIIDETRPVFTLWENVCGVFSSNGGADFIWFVNRCAESGYSLAWRVLDAQYTMTEEFPRAVPQRRRRVWLVGYRGNDWRIPARIVFELDKKLTANPPDRVPGKGFKTLNKDFVAYGNSTATAKPKEEEQSLFLVSLGTDDGSDELLKVSKMIDFSDMPDESDFSKVSMADIFSFVKKVGVPGYVGPVFRTDKKKSKKAKKDEPVFDLFNLDAAKPTEAVSTEADESENEEWVGAEKITPAILENIGNAGIMANGRIATISCHEWTSGIQLSPKTQAAWDELVKNKEWLKANELLPEAYDETVCGLSDVLQEDPDEKYNLSWRASFGILKRAKTRGKELPAALGIALVSTIRENAGIVKWAALNGKDTKKNESDLSERENAMLCFNEYIAPVAKFEDVEAVQPKRKNDGESDIEEDVDEADVEVDDDGNPITKDDDFPFGDDCETTGKETSTEVDKPAMPDLANGVINVSGGETAATLLASGDAAVGTTQDANIIALKKEGRFQEDA